MLLDGSGCLSYRRPQKNRTRVSVNNTDWTLSRPVIVFVQPRERLVNTSRNYINNSVKNVTISPDFSQFHEAGASSIKRFPTNSSNKPIISSAPRITKYVDYEEVLKQIEEERPSQDIELQNSQKIIQQFNEENNNIIEEENQSEFIDIPLQIDDKNGDGDKLNTEEDSQILSTFFDRLLIDIYPNLIKNADYNDGFGIYRRCSDSRLHEINKQQKEPLCRHHSYCVGLEVSKYQHTVCSNKLFEQEDVKKEEPPFCLQKVESSMSLLEPYKEDELWKLGNQELHVIKSGLQQTVDKTGGELKQQLETKMKNIYEQEDLCAKLSSTIQLIPSKFTSSDDSQVKFSLSPVTQDQSGFSEWARAMRMVARLPDGVPAHFRKNLWLSLAERHLNNKGVSNWTQTERRLFSEYSNMEDRELSVQIVKDLHRTGCSLFCGVTGKHNQAVLKRVLLAYARWNKNVGYCQGLNMLAALILQVMQGSQSATVKVMIYLIEGVLPESYFANNLRGLSVDMAVFRDLLKLKLPELSRHLDHLQQDSKDSGTSYEPPLCDVFTMQWFLTIFSNCLPQATVLRVWDLMFLEGDQILLRTALAIWQTLSERMMSVRSADEFYSIMAVLTREMMEFGLMEPNSLIKAVDNMNIPEVGDLREKYVYNISPWTVSTVARRGLKLFYPDPYEQDQQGTSCESSDTVSEPRMTPYSNHPDREKIALDITALKRQYCKLRERQRQAHIILSACRGEGLANTSSPALNHLLLGKRALLSVKGRRIEGTVPPEIAQQKAVTQNRTGQTLHWRDAEKKWRWSDRSSRPSRSPSPYSSSTSSSSTELCDDSSDSDEASASPLPRDETDIHNQTEPIPETTKSTSTSPSTTIIASPPLIAALPAETSTITDRHSPSSFELKPAEFRPSSLSPPTVDESTAPIEDIFGDHSESPPLTTLDNEKSSPIDLPLLQSNASATSPQQPSLSKSPSGSPAKSHIRRDSEMALLQILQENSQILQRIQSSHSSIASSSTTSSTTIAISSVPHQPSFEEPDDIKEIRRKYERISAQNSQENR